MGVMPEVGVQTLRGGAEVVHVKGSGEGGMQGAGMLLQMGEGGRSEAAHAQALRHCTSALVSYLDLYPRVFRIWNVELGSTQVNYI